MKYSFAKHLMGKCPRRDNVVVQAETQRKSFLWFARKKVWVIVFLSVFAVSGPCPGEDVSLKKVSLMPQWLPQAQFTGYMVALDKGLTVILEANKPRSGVGQGVCKGAPCRTRSRPQSAVSPD